MQDGSGRVFLKVGGILMIIGGIFSIIVSGVLGIVGYISGNIVDQNGEYGTGQILGAIIIIAAIIALIGAFKNKKAA